MADLPIGRRGLFDPTEEQPRPVVLPQRDLPLGNTSPFAVPMTTAPSAPQPTGMEARGNLDLTMRPTVHNPDGSVSSVRSSSFGQDGKEVLVPTVSSGGAIMGDPEAWRQYQQTGENLGVFRDVPSADAYAQQLHEDYANGKIPGYPAVDDGSLQARIAAMRPTISRGFHPYQPVFNPKR
jgi:hypothetical protein